MARELPQYISQLNIGSMPKIQMSMAGAEATQRISAQAAGVALDMQEKANRIDKLRATTELRTNLHRISEEAGADPALFKSKVDGFRKGFIKGIKNGSIAEEFDVTFDAEALPYQDKVTDKYRRNLDIDHKKTILDAQARNITTVGEFAPGLFSAIPEEREAARNALARISEETAANATVKDSDGNTIFSAEQQIAMAGEMQSQVILSLPPEQRLQAVGDVVGGYQANLKLVHQAEINPNKPDQITSDGDGTRAYRGINSGANEAEFKQIEALLASGKNMDARAIADKLYKEKYWDAVGIDSLPANVQGIIFDASVNQGEGYAKQLVKEVQKGATPSQLLEMRRERYSKTKGTDAERRSWENRLAKFDHLAATEYLDYVTPEMRNKIKDTAIREIEAENKLRIEDPIKWARQRGLNLDDAVQAQGDPFYASVMDKDEAKATAQQMQQVKSADDVQTAAQAIQEKYGDRTRNAIMDLKAAGMKPAYEAALSLSLQNPTAYKEHIELLTQLGEVVNDKGETTDGVAAVTENFKLKGFKTKDLDSALADKTAEWVAMKQNEGMDLVEQQQQLSLIKNLAMARMVKSGGDYESALDFAMGPEANNYSTAMLNGVMYRVPKSFDVNVIEDRVQQAYSDLLPSIAEANKKKNFHLSDAIIPYLNEKGDGLEFMTPIREPIIDSKGQKVTLRFEDVVNNESRNERIKRIRQEMMNLPYGERNKLREKAFGIKIDVPATAK